MDIKAMNQRITENAEAIVTHVGVLTTSLSRQDIDYRIGVIHDYLSQIKRDRIKIFERDEAVRVRTFSWDDDFVYAVNLDTGKVFQTDEDTGAICDEIEQDNENCEPGFWIEVGKVLGRNE